MTTTIGGKKETVSLFFFKLTGKMSRAYGSPLFAIKIAISTGIDNFTPTWCLNAPIFSTVPHVSMTRFVVAFAERQRVSSGSVDAASPAPRAAWS